MFLILNKQLKYLSVLAIDLISNMVGDISIVKIKIERSACVVSTPVYEMNGHHCLQNN